MPKTTLVGTKFCYLPEWEKENFQEALAAFVNSCKTKKTQTLYSDLCHRAQETKDAKAFLEKEFTPYQINASDGCKTGLLTGYYEPQLRGSLTKTEVYKYPVHKTPDDLIIVDLGSVYPELKKYRLRGKIVGNKLVPYYARKDSEKQDNTPENIICYVDSKIDLFFLEIQGSGRVLLDNGENIYIGYDNQNGHPYKAIGRYLVKKKELKLEDVSLQSIRAWLEKNPARIDEVLNYNDSLVYFKQKDKPASGSLGIELTPKRSIAIDRKFIPLGSLLYLSADVDENKFCNVVLAQDTGGAINGAVRADLFMGHGEDAMQTAGKLKSEDLKLWILLPKHAKEDGS
ncbi:MAG: transglycosylase [Sulfurimonas sp.]|nr:transglycosylase [Sulfurimonas sp.]MBU1215925.1 murein transglycosylase A [bacterium]MBU1435604.1 murein transglycosylase A [bacterium]MBU1502472.1 murein transglycosylase A [bacterium]MBU3938115.1 murein transglycosylase A [bacterium]